MAMPRLRLHRHFNPRSREGSDRSSGAPSHTVSYFNPRSREGSDISGRRGHIRIRDFNPRSREGSDFFFPARCACLMHFNPRSREGSDVPNVTVHILPVRISIHAPARGATDELEQAGFISVFQSTLPRGERRIPCGCMYGAYGISIHAPARGATIYFNRCGQGNAVFQSTLPRGERHFAGA